MPSRITVGGTSCPPSNSRYRPSYPSRCSRGTITRLHEAIRHVLQKGIRNNGASIDWVYPDGRMQQRLTVYGREGKSCPRCGSTIRRLIVGQRSTHICPRCQRPGRNSREPARRPGTTTRRLSHAGRAG